MKLTEQQKEIALRVANEMRAEPKYTRFANHEEWGQYHTEFAARFLAALPKPEPVAWQSTNNSLFVTTSKSVVKGWESSGYEVRNLYAEAHIAPPASEQKPAVPDVLFDGYSVLSALAEHQRARTSPENVSDVLDAVVRLIRTSGSAPQPDYKAQRDGLLDALRTCDDGLALLDQDKFGAMRLMIGRAIAAAKGEK